MIKYLDDNGLARFWQNAKSRLLVGIDPDDYDGTDSEKLAAALADADTDGNDTIILKRMYELTSNLEIAHEVESNKRWTFMGLGPDCGIDCKGYSIVSAGVNTNHGMCSFINLYFTGTGNIFTCAYLLRLNFVNCTFDKCQSVFYNSHYMQSIYLTQCTVRDTTDYVIKSDSSNGVQILDVQLSQCLVERCAGFVTGYSYYGMSVIECCVEGLYGPVCVVTGDARGLTFVSNYFESNNNGYYLPEGQTANNGESFIFTDMTGPIQQLRIADNRFIAVADNEIILMPTTDQNTANIIIENNITSGDVILVKAASGFNTMYRHIFVSGSPRSKFATDEATMFLQPDKSNMYTSMRLPDDGDWNNAHVSGFYYVPASQVTLSNAPFNTGTAYYLIHHQRYSATSFFQIAFSASNVKFRIGIGAWVTIL